MVATVTSSTATSGTSSSSSSGQTTAQEQTDRFLKLLVAQLNNQDPMNPMDNAQMTSQIAQINTVSGIQNLNETMKSMATQFSTMQVLQGASMVGREVLTEGKTLSIKNGVGRGSMDLASDVDKLSVEITTPGGASLGTVQLGAAKAGRVNFEWDASSYTGTDAPIFKITATLGGKAVDTMALARNTVESVSNDAGTLNLSLNNGSTVAYDAIKTIL